MKFVEQKQLMSTSFINQNPCFVLKFGPH